MSQSRGNTVVDFCKRRADDLVTEGLKAASQGFLERASSRFKASLRLQKTAPAYTYWAWMESKKNNFDIAIHLCREAIHLDPNFGNPYNDIGSYYVALGQLDEALVWFDKAKYAPRYKARHFPYMNSGRIFREKKNYGRAILEYKEAQKLSPGDESIRAAITELEALLLQN